MPRFPQDVYFNQEKATELRRPVLDSISPFGVECDAVFAPSPIASQVSLWDGNESPSSRAASTVRRTVGLFLIPIVVLSSLGCGNRDSIWLGGLSEVARIATLEVRLRKILVGEEKQKLFGITYGEARHVASTFATVKLGMDFKKFAPADAKITGRRIELLLPPIELIDFTYDPVHFERRDDLSTNSFWVEIKVKELEEIYRQGDAQLRDSLPHLDLEERTQQRCVSLITAYLRSHGFNEVYVRFRDRERGEYLFEWAPEAPLRMSALAKALRDLGASIRSVLPGREGE